MKIEINTGLFRLSKCIEIKYQFEEEGRRESQRERERKTSRRRRGRSECIVRRTEACMQKTEVPRYRDAGVR